MKKLPMLVVAAAALCSGLAFGQNITQTLTFSGVPDFSSPLVFNQFNGDPSHLLDIIISYDFTIEGGQFIVDNDADTETSMHVKFGASLSGSSSDVSLINNAFQPIFSNVSAVNEADFVLAPNIGDSLGDYDPSGPDGAILIGTTQNASGSDSVASLVWGQYVGNGTFTIDIDTMQVGSLSYNSGIETATTPVLANGQVTITYVVPEPSASILAGIAGLGLAFRRRRA